MFNLGERLIKYIDLKNFDFKILIKYKKYMKMLDSI